MNPMQKNSNRQSGHDDNELNEARRSFAGVAPFDLV
jgi:hypothetical protein